MPDDIFKKIVDDVEGGQEDVEGLDMSGLGDLDALLGLAAAEEVDELSGLEDDIELSEVEPEQETVFLDAVSQMSEEEIEKLLVNAGEVDDAEDLTVEANDDELREIQELLQKSDNNEIIDEDLEMFAASSALGEADALLAAIENNDSGENIDKKQQRELDKQRKKEERAAKKTEKEANRAKKKEERMNAKAQKKKTAENAGGSEKEDLDTNALDNIVFGAEHLGLATGDAKVMSDGTVNAGNATSKSESTSQDNGLGVDISTLFGLGVSDSDLNLGAADADFAAAVASRNDGEADAESAKAENDAKKKKGFWSKLLNFLLEEEEEAEEKGNETIQLSEENEDILKDLDSKKGGKKRKKKGKKDNAEEKKNADTDEDEEEPQKSKKQSKLKRIKKLKTEKAENIPVLYEPGKKLSFKKALPIVALGVTVFAVILICGSVSTDYADKKNAREAYYSGDYQTCYENLFGKDLDETEEVMFGKSKSILYIRLWYREYEMLAEKGLRVEALDSLIQTVEDYPELYEYAEKWNAAQEVNEVYTRIITILNDQYGISEVQALEIAAVKRDKIYTQIVTALANGEVYGSWGGSNEEVSAEEEKTPHELPEESGMGQGNFVDNR